MITRESIRQGMRVRLANDFKKRVCKEAQDKIYFNSSIVVDYGNSVGVVEKIDRDGSEGLWVKWDNGEVGYMFFNELCEVKE
jgi:hypothetical protein